MHAARLRDRAIVFALGFILLAAFACGGSKAIELDADDDAAEVEVSVDQEVIVRLEGNITTGYTWAVDSDAGGRLRLVGEIEYGTESNRIGAGGMQTLRFKAVAPGEGDLTLIYHQPFDTEADPVREFSVSVIVK